MQKYTSLDLQQHTGEIQSAAMREPVALTFHGRPRTMMLSVHEFCRLKAAAGEPVPSDLLPRRSVVQRGLPEDPLGYDTRDLMACARAMAETALSGRNRSAVEAEIAAVEKRLGLRPAR